MSVAVPDCPAHTAPTVAQFGNPGGALPVMVMSPFIRFGCTVTVAVACLPAWSETVNVTAWDDVTAPGVMTICVAAKLALEMGNTLLLLETIKKGARRPPPENTNVIGTPEYAVAVDGDMLNVSAGFESADTAPLPHELSMAKPNPASNIVMPWAITLFIFTKNILFGC